MRTRAERGRVGRYRSISQAVDRATAASTPPRIASSQKWLAVAMIEKNYSTLLADHSDAITRAALIELA